ncbi:MAG: hypothetical protein WC211_03700 [Dehalococcoidia bacterium]
MSRNQRKILTAIARYIDQHGFSPSLREIQAMTGISSTSVVAYNRDRLAALGFIDFHHEISRSMTLTEHGRLTVGADLEAPR